MASKITVSQRELEQIIQQVVRRSVQEVFKELEHTQCIKDIPIVSDEEQYEIELLFGKEPTVDEIRMKRKLSI